MAKKLTAKEKESYQNGYNRAELEYQGKIPKENNYRVFYTSREKHYYKLGFQQGFSDMRRNKIKKSKKIN